MKQLIHILKKDIRYVWNELLFFYASLGLYMWTETHTNIDLLTLPIVAKCLIPLAGVFLIVRVIHAEAIPGDNHFWLARPYRWMSLLGAKLVFIVVCLTLPMFVARAATIMLQGFPFLSALPRLVWSQLLMLLIVALPVAMIAALTSSFAQFVIPAMVVIPLVTMTQYREYRGYQNGYWSAGWSSDTLWFLNSLIGLSVALLALGIIVRYYKSRHTFLARSVAVCGLCAGCLIYFFLPPSLGMAANVLLAKPITDTSTVRIHLEPKLDLGWMYFFDPAVMKNFDARIPLRISGIPEGYVARTRTLSVLFENSDGKVESAELLSRGDWPSGSPFWNSLPAGYMGRAFAEAERDRMITIRISVDVLVFAEPEMRTVLLTEKPVNVFDGVQCSLSGCRSAVGWPDRIIGEDAVWGWQPYTPFPSVGLSMDSVEEHPFQSVSKKPEEVHFTSEGPYRRYHQDIVLRNVRVPKPVAYRYIRTSHGLEWITTE